jgi:hypothetical protein
LRQSDQLPQGRESNEDIDGSREDGILAAEDGRDEIELEQANQAPIGAADDNENKGDQVQGLHV